MPISKTKVRILEFLNGSKIQAAPNNGAVPGWPNIGEASGTATLVAGQVVVSSSAVKAGSKILTAIQSLGTVTVPSSIGVSARTVGANFTIKSDQATDTSVIAWWILT